jgi:hemerythrin
MAQVPWQEEYSINYKDIDQQHKALLAVVNELMDLIG